MEELRQQYHMVQRQRSADWDRHKTAGGEVLLQMMEDGLRLLYRLPDKGALCALDEIRFTRNLNQSGKLQQFRQFIPESFLSEAEFSLVRIAADPTAFTLIPSPLFSEETARDLLQLVADVPETDVIFHEKKGDDVHLVFSVPGEWVEWAAGFFTQAAPDWTCLFSGMLQTMSQAGDSAGMLLHVESGRIHCMAKNNEGLSFFNRYRYRTEHDLLYFFLLAMEQSGLEPGSDLVQLCGSIMSGSAGFEKLQRYAGNLRFALPPETESLLPPAAGIRHPLYFDLLTLFPSVQ